MRYYYARSFKWKRAQRGVKVNDGFIGQSSHMLARNTFGVDYDNSAKMHSKLQNYAQQYERELGEYMAQIAPMFNGLSEGEIDQKLMAMHDEKYNEGKPIHRKYSLYGILCLLLMFSSDMIFLTFFKSLFILSPIVVIISLILMIYFFTKGGKALDDADHLRGIIERRKAAAQEAIDAVNQQRIINASNVFMGNR